MHLVFVVSCQKQFLNVPNYGISCSCNLFNNLQANSIASLYIRIYKYYNILKFRGDVALKVSNKFPMEKPFTDAFEINDLAIDR